MFPIPSPRDAFSPVIKKKKSFVGDRHKYRDRQTQIHAPERQGMAKASGGGKR